MPRTKKSRKSKAATRKKSKLSPAAPAAPADEEDAGPSAAERAVEWLRDWHLSQGAGAGDGSWKFNKTRQSFLLGKWQHRGRVPGDAFKLLLLYMRTLPETTRARTLAQARDAEEKAEKAEAELEGAEAEEGGEEGDEAREEQRALLKIRRARALKVIQALTEAAE